jgi:hydrogenase nickel incorporation protein HypB
MCDTCGCGEQTHSHANGHEHTRTVRLEHDVLARNNHLAEHNRAWLDVRGIFTVNLMSSPGAGKTTLLEHTARHLCARMPVGVVEGDQETMRDADRIAASGARAVQINTGTGCHLDATMVARALTQLEPETGSIVFLENVGNLVCPALFDLGEHSKVVIMAVTEGEDKPIKYPHMFRAADLVLLNKVDLLPYLDFDLDACLGYVRRVNSRAQVIQISATTGRGLDQWNAWLTGRMAVVQR